MAQWLANTLEQILDFSNILNASIAASWMVLAVIVLRFLLKKAPRWTHVALWGLVALRLLLPFSIESAFSLIPSTETIPQEILVYEGTQLQDSAFLDIVSNPAFSENITVEVGETVDRVQISLVQMTPLWIAGMAVLLIYTAISYWRLRRKVSEAVILRDNIYQSENVGSPFVLGIIKPKVYLPYNMNEQDLSHVVAHEQAHIRRKDHWWKPLGFLLLTIHWFNPLMWLAYVLLCRDIELACDEKVIKELGNEQRADYTQALVACSVNRRMIAACPLAFGEVGVKERVKSVMNYKKPAFWVIVVAVIACVVVAVCFLTNPSNDEQHAPEPFGHVYKVEEILFDAPQYSFVYSLDTAPKYQFTSDYAMLVSKNVLSQDGSIEWVQQRGGFEEVKITTENFDNYFDMSGFQISNDRWSRFRSSIKKAWRIDIENDENNVFYYLISTKSGEVYLTYGYHDSESETDANSDDSSIRWLFKLARTDLLTCNAVSKGINAFVELICFPNEIDRDTDNWPVAYINEAGTLVFSVETGTNALVVSEDYYRKSENSTFIERNSFEVGRNDDGFFTIDIARRESIEDHVNYFIKIKGQSDVYAMKVVFDALNLDSSIGGTSEPAQLGGSQTLSLNDVIMLSQKGYDLTWSDFEQFEYIETGSGLYIRVYEINEMYELWIGGGWTDEDPMYIYLALADDLDTRIDIRDGGVTEFISETGSKTYDRTLSQEEIEQVRAAFSPIIYDKQGNPISTNVWSCFFTSYYSDVRDMNFAEFLAYFPGDGSMVDEAEFAVLKGKQDFLFYGEVSSLADMPVPVHRYPVRIIDMVLKEYAGITVDDLDTSEVVYLAEYDAFYNHTSDAGGGMFYCTRGEIDGDIVRLYEEFDYGTDMLTLKKVGNNYQIVAHQHVEG